MEKWDSRSPSLRTRALFSQNHEFCQGSMLPAVSISGLQFLKDPKIGKLELILVMFRCGQLNFACEDVYFESLAGTQKTVKSGQIFPFAIG